MQPIKNKTKYAISKKYNAKWYTDALEKQYKLNDMKNQILEQEINFWLNNIELELNNDDQIMPLECNKKT